MDLGWEEWLIVVILILFGLRMSYEEIRKKLFGTPTSYDKPENGSIQQDQTSARPSTGTNRSTPSPADQETAQPAGEREQGTTGGSSDNSPTYITNIEIHDSVITRSTIIGNDEDDDDLDNNAKNDSGNVDPDKTTEKEESGITIEDSIIRRATVGKDR